MTEIIHRPRYRHDIPFKKCLGNCGSKLLSWFYYCNKCRPEWHNEHNRDYKTLEDISSTLRYKNDNLLKVKNTKQATIREYYFESLNKNGEVQ